MYFSSVECLEVTQFLFFLIFFFFYDDMAAVAEAANTPASNTRQYATASPECEQLLLPRRVINIFTFV
jgi:hypothetical protein